jgi:serine/threonine protein kinase
MLGTSLSHYRITEKLGQGGMGEVYRAEDTNLSRQVAIKVLPDEFAHDAERLARFEREAKLLASLRIPEQVGQ